MWLVLEASVYFAYPYVTVSSCFTFCFPSLQSGSNELMSASEWCRRAEMGPECKQKGQEQGMIWKERVPDFIQWAVVHCSSSTNHSING